MTYQAGFENSVSLLMKQVAASVDSAHKYNLAATDRPGEPAYQFRMEKFQHAHQALLNGIISSNIAVVTELKHLRRFLEEQYEGYLGKKEAEGDPA